MNPVHFSSACEEWETPHDLFDYLNKIHKFTLDPCATVDNHLCDKFYTREDDGLAKSWAGESVFMNPPYGRKIPGWMKKAFNSTLEDATVVCLVPARTDTQWWHNYAQKGVINFEKGRLKFRLRITDAMRNAVQERREKTIKEISDEIKLPKFIIKGILDGAESALQPAPFPSAIVTFSPRCKHCQQTLK